MLVFGVTFAAFLLRWSLHRQNPVASRDGSLYLSIIEQLQVGGPQLLSPISMVRAGRELPPLFLLICRRLTEFGIDARTAAFGLNLVCGALLCAVMYGIARNCFRSTAAAVTAALLTAAHPGWVELSGSAQREPLFLLLTAGGILAAQSALLNRRPWQMTAAAALFLLAFLCRYEGALPLLLLPPVATGFAVLLGRSRREIAAQLACYAGSAGILLLLVTAFNSNIRNYLIDCGRVLIS